VSIPPPYLPPLNPGILFPTVSSVLPKTDGVAIRSPSHLFSMRGETADEGPFGQNMSDLELFMGATSRNCLLRSRDVEKVISVELKQNEVGERKASIHLNVISACNT
jgi:hypothetical protein